MVNIGCFSSDFVRYFIAKHKISLNYFSKGFLKMAQVLLNSKTKILIDIGGTMVGESFFKFDEIYQYNIVAMLISFVGSQKSLQISMALDVFIFIAEHNADALSPFMSFVKNMLDFVENFSHDQVKRLYTVLGHIYLTASNEISMDDLLITVLKQLNHPYKTFQAIGVVGALILIPFLINNTGFSQSQRGLTQVSDLFKSY